MIAAISTSPADVERLRAVDTEATGVQELPGLGLPGSREGVKTPFVQYRFNLERQSAAELDRKPRPGGSAALRTRSPSGKPRLARRKKIDDVERRELFGKRCVYLIVKQDILEEHHRPISAIPTFDLKFG